ncbi:MAG: hypothetical protein QM500_14365 [Methylococcales bacterium]
MEVIAKQCGTSVAMIEQHYSHVVPKMFTNELSGVELKQDKLVNKSHKLPPKAIIKRTEKMKNWEIEYKKRGCI